MIRKATVEDARVAAELACKLWPGHSVGDITAELCEVLCDTDCAIFLSYAGVSAVGFAQCGLRHDYVEGTETSPVGYLEGIYIEEAFRKKGYARELLTACQQWDKAKGCKEFASDCELSNTQSLRFHLHCGFEEANRIICFTKKL